MAVTLFVCHVSYEVTKDVVHRLADDVDPAVINSAGPPPDQWMEWCTATPEHAGPAGQCW
jgi:hypothetical protein